MTINDFIQSIQGENISYQILQLPQSELLTAMWHEGKGDWEKAHSIAQEKESPLFCLVHAYLHRKEGDQWNAGYWYRRAGRAVPSYSLAEEWEKIVTELLAE